MSVYGGQGYNHAQYRVRAVPAATRAAPSRLADGRRGRLPPGQPRRRRVPFFQLINAQHERASTVLASNTGFEERGHVLGDGVMTAAFIDRLAQQASRGTRA